MPAVVSVVMFADLGVVDCFCFVRVMTDWFCFVRGWWLGIAGVGLLWLLLRCIYLLLMILGSGLAGLVYTLNYLLIALVCLLLVCVCVVCNACVVGCWDCVVFDLAFMCLVLGF